MAKGAGRVRGNRAASARGGTPRLRSAGGPSASLAAPAFESLRSARIFCSVANAEGDDFGVNILDRSELNRLYNLLDLCLVSSRWEGGPHSILEACFAKTKVLSTRVGISEDVLEEASLFDTIPEAVSRISDDIRHRTLDATREAQYRNGAHREYAGAIC